MTGIITKPRTLAISETLADTLALFGRGELSAAQVLDRSRDEVTVPALNNRLERLRGLGLLTRRRVGRTWRYRRNGKAAHSSPGRS